MGSISKVGKLEIEKPHAVCIPYPAQGHINPMLKLSKLLHHRGFHITFVNTEFNHKRLLKSRGPHSLDGLSSFRFETIPDGLPESDVDATQDIPSLCESTQKHGLAPFRDLLSKLNDTASSNVPPVTCIVSDGVMSFTLDDFLILYAYTYTIASRLRHEIFKSKFFGYKRGSIWCFHGHPNRAREREERGNRTKVIMARFRSILLLTLLLIASHEILFSEGRELKATGKQEIAGHESRALVVNSSQNHGGHGHRRLLLDDTNEEGFSPGVRHFSPAGGEEQPPP